MRPTCGVMSARTPIMRCYTGSIRRKVSEAIAAPMPDSSASSNSISWWLDPLIAPGGEAGHQALHHRGLERGIGAASRPSAPRAADIDGPCRWPCVGRDLVG